MSFVQEMARPAVDDARISIDSARRAQTRWAALPVARRLERIRELRFLIGEEALSLAAASAKARSRPLAETMTAEVFPLVEACAFLERKAPAILAPRHFGKRAHPIWLPVSRTEIVREPIGVVLIIGPANYPLMLPGIQVVQALVAGNAVLLKPGRGGFDAARALAHLLSRAGIDPALLTVLPERQSAVNEALEAGPDKVIFTGSAEVGERILSQLAPRLIPAVMELSGCDAMIVRADADLELVVSALRFSLSLNAGETCVAPRRLLVDAKVAAELELRLGRAFADAKALSLDQCRRIGSLAREALDGGARVVAGRFDRDDSIEGPLILAGVSPAEKILQTDVFAPALAILRVKGDEEAVAIANACPYGLGASVFSRDERGAGKLSKKLRAGVVTINDVILPTAGGHVPFGGRGRSGFGVTRGAEGLLELTAPKVVTISRGRFRPAFDATRKGDELLFQAYLRCAYGRSVRDRLGGLAAVFRHLVKRQKRRKERNRIHE